MKKRIAVLLSFVYLFGLSLPAVADEVTNLTFDDDTPLTVVTNSLANGGSAVYEDGFIGKSLSLNGTYGVALGNVGDTFSVSAMVKITSTGGTNTVFFKNMGTSSSQKWTGVLSNAGKPSFWTHGDGYGWTTVASGSDAVLGTWSHVVYVEQGGTGSLYVNGALVGSGGVARGSGQLYLGATYWSADAPAGLVDEVKVYDSALSLSDIAKDYESYIEHMISVPGEVIGDIELTDAIGSKVIVWETSDSSVIKSDGTVTRGEEDKTVTLTAKVDGNVVGTFDVTVLKKPVIVNDEVVLSYKFTSGDGTIIHDVSGNGNHAVSSGGLEIGENGAAFDGLDDYVTMPEGVLYGNDDISIVVKFKPNGAQKHVFLYGFGNGNDTGYIFLNPSRPATNTLRFAATKTGSTGEKDIATLPGIRNNEWATVVVTLSGSDAAMYVDGDLVMDGNIGMDVSDLGQTTKNYIAKSLYDADPYFAGEISEFTVYGYTMSESEIESLYKKDVEYAPENVKEEYITSVSFDDGIDVTLDTYGRDDVKIGVVVLDENNETVEFTVVNSSDEINLTQTGTVIVFAFNEADNIPGKIYVKGEADGFSYEYTPDGMKIVCSEDYRNGMVLIAGYDTYGTLTGVSIKICDITAGEKVVLDGEFDNAVTFKMLYWENLVSMVPVE